MTLPSSSDISMFYGAYLEPDERYAFGSLSLKFQSGSLDIDELWKSSSLSAEFLSTFWGQFMPDAGRFGRSRETVTDEVHFICSELLGNAAKFSYHSGYMIEICLLLHRDELRIYVTNSLDPCQLPSFLQLIRKILTEDTQTLFIEQMERAAVEANNESGIGYLTLINDYHVSLGWKFQSAKPGVHSVTTLARLPVVRRDEGQ